MPFSPTSPYHTPAPTAMSASLVLSDKNNPTPVRSATQPIPVKMVMSNVRVEPQQGLLIDTASNTPAQLPTATKTEPINMTTVSTVGISRATGNSTETDVGVGSTYGNGGPRLVPPQALLAQQQQRLFTVSSSSSSSSFFDKDKKGTGQSPATSTTPSPTSSNRTVEATTKPKSTTLGIIPSPHDNNKPFKSTIGIPCLVKQQSPASSSTIAAISSEIPHQPTITENAINDNANDSTQKTQSSTMWINLLNTLKDQIQQIQHERQQEKMAYLAREMERRELEQKMLDEIKKTGEQLAMVSQQLQDEQQFDRKQQRYRSKSAERQPSTSDENTRPGSHRRPHSFSSSLPSLELQQQQHNDYHSAIEDDSDHDTKVSKGKGKGKGKSTTTQNNGTRPSSVMSLSSSSSSASSGDRSSSKDLSDGEENDNLWNARKDHQRPPRPSQHHRRRHHQKPRQSNTQDSPSLTSSKHPPQQRKRKSQYTPSPSASSSPTLQYYMWGNSGYYPHHPPPSAPMHPSQLPPLSNQYYPHPAWIQQMHGNSTNTPRNYSTPPSSYYTFPPMMPPPPNSNEKRRYPSNAPPAPQQQQQHAMNPPSSHTSASSATQYRTPPSSTSNSFPHRLPRPPPFHHPSAFLPPEKSGLFM